MHKFCIFLTHVPTTEDAHDVPPLYIGLKGPKFRDGLMGGDRSYMGQCVWDEIMRALGVPPGQQIDPLKDLKDGALKVNVVQSSRGSHYVDVISAPTEQEREACKQFVLSHKDPF